jgi:uncharacterized repeat protein (TIGR03833 family)
MRDPRRRDHLAPGLLVKIVRPEDEATGLTVEGEIQEIVGREPIDENGVVVRLASGEVGRVLRIWEGGRARELPLPEETSRREPALPTHDPPRREPYHHQFRISEGEVDKKAQETLAGADAREIERMILHHEEGLGAPLLRRYGIRSDELEEKTRELLRGLSDEELERRLGRAPAPEDDRDD